MLARANLRLEFFQSLKDQERAALLTVGIHAWPAEKIENTDRFPGHHSTADENGQPSNQMIAEQIQLRKRAVLEWFPVEVARHNSAGVGLVRSGVFLQLDRMLHGILFQPVVFHLDDGLPFQRGRFARASVGALVLRKSESVDWPNKSAEYRQIIHEGLEVAPSEPVVDSAV
jgi:hypothetical protein